MSFPTPQAQPDARVEVVNVVGMSFVPGYPAILEGLKPDVEYFAELHRNPANEYDTNAIEVHVGHVMVGHLPRDVAARLAPALDSGGRYDVQIWKRVHPDKPQNPGLTVRLVKV